MKWTFSIENKLKASLTLLLLIGVVLFSNYRLKKLSGRVAVSVESIYKDRLVVQHLIFSFSQIVEDLEEFSSNATTANELNQINQKVAGLNKEYLLTVLTEEESRVFQSFTHNLGLVLKTSSLGVNKDQLAILKNDLVRLEAIQMEEAKRQMGIIDDIKSSQELGFYLETAVLVVLLLIVQVLIVANTTVKKVAEEKDFNLN